jgi:phage head maturation protease
MMARLKNLQVAFISLVKKPANKKDIIYKSMEGKFTDEKELKIFKSELSKGLVYGTVYEPNVKDSDGDWTDADTIQRAAHEFLEKGNLSQVDLNHQEEPIGARVVESYIDPKGAWQVVIKMDPKSDVFEKIEKGEIKGLSMGAWCEKSDEELKTDNREDVVMKSLKELEETLKGFSERLDRIEKGVEKVPKSRQLLINGDSIKMDKAEEPFPEFNFKYNELKD